MEINIKELFDLPAHALVLHMPIILIPLVATAAVFFALRPHHLDRWGLVFGLVAAATIVSVWVSVGTGNEFEKLLKESDPGRWVGIEAWPTHETRGRNMIPFTNWFSLALIGFGMFRYWARHSMMSGDDSVGSAELATAGERGASSAAKISGVAFNVFRLLTVATSVWLIYYIILVGHSGAQVVHG